MRYVYDSCDPSFAAFNLYFGQAGEGVAGLCDRAIPKEKGRLSQISTRYVVNPTAPGVPELARRFITESVRGGEGKQ